MISDELPKLYLLDGHGEAELPSEFQAQIEKENMALESFSLLNTDEIPEDANTLLIYAPESDISSEEAGLLEDYLEDGGKLLVIAGPTENGTLTNLYSVLESYTIELGDFSKMDEQRYVSIGDGKAYLVSHDPLDEFGAVLRDMILDDTIPEFDTAKQIAFSGSENYVISYDEDGTSICADDVYFTDGKPLDTDTVNEWLTALMGLDLTDYVSYNITNEELQTFGLDNPALTITIDYSSSGENWNETDAGTLVLHLAQNPEELAAYEEALANEEDELPDVTCYARVGDSQIVYQITQAEFDVYDLRTALRSLTAVSFTDEQPTGQEEISLVIHLDNDDFPTFTLTLYRYDGETCLACVDGEPTAFVSRSQTVDLVEAVRAVVLGASESSANS